MLLVLPEEDEGSSPSPFSISFVTQKGSSRGQSTFVRLAISNVVESENVEFQSKNLLISSVHEAYYLLSVEQWNIQLFYIYEQFKDRI